MPIAITGTGTLLPLIEQIRVPAAEGHPETVNWPALKDNSLLLDCIISTWKELFVLKINNIPMNSKRAQCLSDTEMYT